MKIEGFEIKIYKALAHPVRLKIVKKLAGGGLCVCELFDESEFSQPNISQHLKILRDADVVSYKKESNKLIYNLRHIEIVKILELAQDIVHAEINSLVENS